MFHTDINQARDSLANVTATMPVLPGGATMKGGHIREPMNTRLHNKLIQKDQNRKTQSYKVESVSRGANMDLHNFSLENKRESEYVSCSHRFLLISECCRSEDTDDHKVCRR